jgi:hypothetical protein
MKHFHLAALLLACGSVAFAQMQIKNSAGVVAISVTLDNRVGIGTTTPEAGTALDVVGITKTTGLRVATSTEGQALVATGVNGAAGWGTVGSAGVTDNSLTAGDLAVNVVSSVDGVVNDGGNIDLLAGNGIAITPDNGNKTVTVAMNPSIIEIMLLPAFDLNPFEFRAAIANTVTISPDYTLQPGTYLANFNGTLSLLGPVTTANCVGWLRLYNANANINYLGMHANHSSNYTMESHGTHIFTLTEATVVQVKVAWSPPDNTNYLFSYSRAVGAPIVQLVKLL